MAKESPTGLTKCKPIYVRLGVQFVRRVYCNDIHRIFSRLPLGKSSCGCCIFRPVCTSKRALKSLPQRRDTHTHRRLVCVNCVCIQSSSIDLSPYIHKREREREKAANGSRNCSVGIFLSCSDSSQTFHDLFRKGEAKENDNTHTRYKAKGKDKRRRRRYANKMLPRRV